MQDFTISKVVLSELADTSLQTIRCLRHYIYVSIEWIWAARNLNSWNELL